MDSKVILLRDGPWNRWASTAKDDGKQDLTNSGEANKFIK